MAHHAIPPAADDCPHGIAPIGDCERCTRPEHYQPRHAKRRTPDDNREN